MRSFMVREYCRIEKKSPNHQSLEKFKSLLLLFILKLNTLMVCWVHCLNIAFSRSIYNN